MTEFMVFMKFMVRNILLFFFFLLRASPKIRKCRIFMESGIKNVCIVMKKFIIQGRVEHLLEFLS